MKEDAIQKMYEYDLAVFNDDRAHHRYDVEILSPSNRRVYSCPIAVVAPSATPSVDSGINRIQRWSQSKPPYLAFLYFFASIYSIQSRGQGCHQE